MIYICDIHIYICNAMHFNALPCSTYIVNIYYIYLFIHFFYSFIYLYIYIYIFIFIFIGLSIDLFIDIHMHVHLDEYSSDSLLFQIVYLLCYQHFGRSDPAPPYFTEACQMWRHSGWGSGHWKNGGYGHGINGINLIDMSFAHRCWTAQDKPK